MSTETVGNETKAAIAGAQGGTVAPEKTTSKRVAPAKKGAHKGRKTAKAAKPAVTAKPKKTAKKATEPAKTAESRPEGVRQGSKTATILDLLRRVKGATLAEIMEASSWQAHSVRGFISGTLGKKMGLTVKSEKREDGTRIYSIGK